MLFKMAENLVNPKTRRKIQMTLVLEVIRPSESVSALGLVPKNYPEPKTKLSSLLVHNCMYTSYRTLQQINRL
jgi:hypothetical protein